MPFLVHRIVRHHQQELLSWRRLRKHCSGWRLKGLISSLLVAGGRWKKRGRTGSLESSTDVHEGCTVNREWAVTGGLNYSWGGSSERSREGLDVGCEVSAMICRN